MKFTLSMLTLPVMCCFLPIYGCSSGNSVQAGSGAPSITMSPKITSLAVGATQQFTAVVTNASNVWWYLSLGDPREGIITSNGLYTAPSVPPINDYDGFPGTQGLADVQVRADGTAPTNNFFGVVVRDSNSFVITAPSVIVGFIKGTASVPLGGTFHFQPYAVGAMDRTYTLQVNGVTGGSLSAGSIVQDANNAGLYTAPTAMPMTGSTVTITVKSTADPTKTATATVTLY